MEFVKIAKIINTFGIKGELKLESYTDFADERFKKDSIVYVGEDKLPFVMKSHKMHKGFLLIQFKDNEDINLVEKYKNMYIYKNKEDIHALDKGEYYFSDLVNLDVYDVDKLVGRVIKVQEGISSNYLRVLVNGKEKLIPFIPVFIKDVDLENKKIFINNVEGLLWRLQS